MGKPGHVQPCLSDDDLGGVAGDTRDLLQPDDGGQHRRIGAPAGTAADEGLVRFAIVGFSVGGPVAVRAAIRHPGRVSALVLTAMYSHLDNT